MVTPEAMPGMEAALAEHEPLPADYGDNIRCLCGAWRGIGSNADGWASNLAQVLTEAGYGVLPDVAGPLARLAAWVMNADVTDALDVLHILSQGDLPAALERTTK